MRVPRMVLLGGNCVDFWLEHWWGPPRSTLSSDVQELLVHETELPEYGLWIVLNFAYSTASNVNVFSGCGRVHRFRGDALNLAVS
ncbi:unnamed protein product [Toxocara canis]|uniref:Uncharacterized protein n=1 Tax=Toxocara canis TaxID=6265 RepID=A0A183TXQ3_TOXCA|nr:unnamed protein product [Toxocara canis]